MTALLIALAVLFGYNMIFCLYHISQAKPVTIKPKQYVWMFVRLSVFLAFILYALLNWI